ncbi:hypothetical protein J31TS4_18870 [Paenibacillus sp. J31TS4]|uniref:hypothetical protein n=1 Tax=Paenibacillus sp. J31TS4 TaxID=2807195 RepID=UPI001B1DF596|nr:hypothetical protein [Paenibacillus sp. J31TS4]GIP38607.1 hypothetical protein J31TS4_18870 [Paenibacillus sp. J31TS4]
MQTIKTLTVLTNPEKRFVVGERYNGKVVGEIIDASCEWEDSIDFLYGVRDASGQPIARIENCPVIVEFQNPGEKESEE